MWFVGSGFGSVWLDVMFHVGWYALRDVINRVLSLSCVYFCPVSSFVNLCFCILIPSFSLAIFILNLDLDP